MDDVIFKFIVFSSGVHGVGDYELDYDYFTKDEIKRQEELGNKLFDTKESAEQYINEIYTA
ncbi:MAG: hypothetical protein WCO84_01155 [bacterium]